MPPFTPRSAMMRMMRSFDVDARGQRARAPRSSLTFGRVRDRVCVARMSRICEVPTPKARLPSAPWVEVCESPQAMVMPGWVRPSSGPMMWTIPCSSVPRPKKRMPCSFVLRSMACIIASACSSAKGRLLVVGGHDVVHRGEGAAREHHLQPAVRRAPGRPGER